MHGTNQAMSQPKQRTKQCANEATNQPAKHRSKHASKQPSNLERGKHATINLSANQPTPRTASYTANVSSTRQVSPHSHHVVSRPIYIYVYPPPCALAHAGVSRSLCVVFSHRLLSFDLRGATDRLAIVSF